MPISLDFLNGLHTLSSFKCHSQFRKGYLIRLNKKLPVIFTAWEQVMKIINKTVLLLSLVSLLNDISSEMLYPVMPLYLKSIGFGVVLIGVLEGFAEALSGISKGYFGKLSDQAGQRLPFIRTGYFFSALSKPMMAVFTFPAWVFGARSLDRIGKGIRTAARDAMLSDATVPAFKARVFGFHRAFDTVGATIGPMLALLFIYKLPGQYKMLFYLAFIPGICGLFLTYLIKEVKTAKKETASLNPFSFLSYLKTSPVVYNRLIIGLLAFALFNSSDVFLLLMLKQQGLTDLKVIGVYIFYNLVYAISSYPLGHLGDKLGFRLVLIIGLVLFTIVYAGMSLHSGIYLYFFLFLLYGIYAACTESIGKAWISNISMKEDVGTAIGAFTALNSIATMLASALAGLLWYRFGSQVMFLTEAGGVVLVIIYFLLFRTKLASKA